MGKLEYLDALKRALMGLPPETQARTLAWYEQRFVDGSAVGRREQDVSLELGDPRQVALTLRTSAHLAALKDAKPPFNPVRAILSVIGLLVFNLFMLIPAAVFASLLLSLFMSAFGVYVGGIAITASGLAGSSELVLSAPLTRLVVGDDGEPADSQTTISIGPKGIHVNDEPAIELDTGSGSASGSESESGSEAGSEAGSESRAESRAESRSRVVRGAEAVAERRIQISTDMDPGSRTTQVLFGCLLILGGIALFLVSLVVSKYTLSGIRRYVHMNMSLLKA